MANRDFGETISKIRKDRNLTQFSLGKLAGVTDKAVSKWERKGVVPKMDVLTRLANKLDVDLKVLLGEQEPDIPLEGMNLIRHRIKLWNRAELILYKTYGDNPPLQVMNRFGQEKSRLQNSNAIIIFDIIRELRKEAEKQGKFLEGPSSLYSSFVSWLMCASKVNPLPPHYRCPKCHKTVFSDETEDSWDLPDKTCSCGEAMLKNGHDLPFDVAFCGSSAPFTSTEFMISLSFLEEAQKILLRLAGPYFDLGRFVLPAEEKDDMPITCIFFDARDESKKTPEYVDDIRRVENVNNWGTSTSYPAFRFFPMLDPKRTGRKAKPRTPATKDLMQEEVLMRALKTHNLEKEALKEISGMDFTLQDPEKYREGITFSRLVTLMCAMENAYMEDNAEEMADALGMKDPTEYPTSQEDLWKLIQRSCKEDANGAALQIVMKCRDGNYIDSITNRDTNLFAQLNLPEWFPEYARRIIKLCHRGEMTARAMELMKKEWLRMQVKR